VTRRTTLLAACGLVLVLASCSDTEARERLKDNARATWDSAVEVAQETGAMAMQALQERLDELQPRIEELRQRADELQGQARAKLDDLLEDLEVQREDLRRKIEGLRSQSGEAVERLRREALAELDALRERVDRALGGEPGGSDGSPGGVR